MAEPTPAELQRAVGEWAAATFPHQTARTVVRHLREEVEELDHAQTTGDRFEEAADCLLLLLNYAHQHKFSLWDAVQAKFAVCQARQWGPKDADGVVRHAGSKRVRP